MKKILRQQRLTLLDIHRLLIGVGSIAALRSKCQLSSYHLAGGTYDHLVGLATRDTDAMALDDLNIVQTTQDLMLDFEFGAHREVGTFLDLEGLLLQVLQSSRLRKVDDDRLAAGRFHRQGKDNAYARVIGIRQVLAVAQAERSLVALEGLIVLIYTKATVSMHMAVTTDVAIIALFC